MLLGVWSDNKFAQLDNFAASYDVTTATKTHFFAFLKPLCKNASNDREKWSPCGRLCILNILHYKLCKGYIKYSYTFALRMQNYFKFLSCNS